MVSVIVLRSSGRRAWSRSLCYAPVVEGTWSQEFAKDNGDDVDDKYCQLCIVKAMHINELIACCLLCMVKGSLLSTVYCEW